MHKNNLVRFGKIMFWPKWSVCSTPLAQLDIVLRSPYKRLLVSHFKRWNWSSSSKFDSHKCFSSFAEILTTTLYPRNWTEKIHQYSVSDLRWDIASPESGNITDKILKMITCLGSAGPRKSHTDGPALLIAQVTWLSRSDLCVVLSFVIRVRNTQTRDEIGGNSCRK